MRERKGSPRSDADNCPVRHGRWGRDHASSAAAAACARGELRECGLAEA